MGACTGLRRSRVFLIGIVLAVFSAAAGRANAQLLYGSLVGTVVDAQGAAVPGARVTIVNKDNNLRMETDVLDHHFKRSPQQQLMTIHKRKMLLPQ